MQFVHTVHTKEFLISNVDTALQLAKYSSEFALSDLANDADILLLADENGKSVAHYLASMKSQRIESDASTKPEMLKSNDRLGNSIAHLIASLSPQMANAGPATAIGVTQSNSDGKNSIAHYLADNQSTALNEDEIMAFAPEVHTKQYLLSNANVALELAMNSPEFAVSSLANDIELLVMTIKNRGTLAHVLAQYQSQWVSLDAAKSHDILRLRDKFGTTVAHLLAWHQPEWVFTNECMDYEILKLRNNFGATIAHHLAAFQKEWLLSAASKDPEILRLKTFDGTTVAHNLAAYQSKWITSEEAKNLDILKLQHDDGWAVAHTLAEHQPGWIFSDEAKNLDLLKLMTKSGRSVAYDLVEHNEACLKHEPIFHKSILTLEYENRILAEAISTYYGTKFGISIPSIAMKLIVQGAAYKHSKPMSFELGEELFDQAKEIIDDTTEPLVKLKQLQAIHSTFYHQLEKMKSLSNTESIDKWESILLRAESLLENHLNAHTQLFDIEHAVDIFCEPGDDFVKRLASERALKNVLSLPTEPEAPIQEMRSNAGLY
jgi:hypothetical protein